ncbi:MAG: amino acid transporter [Acidimicrobiia bacterium]|nr:amino acid transporter [Acidimicrobiia bacterium]
MGATSFWIEPLDLTEVQSLMAEFRAPWWISGGWAIDLFAGEVTRDHDDVEISVLEGDQDELRSALAGMDLHVAHDGELTPWGAEQRIEHPLHQLWVRRDPAAPWSLEVLFEQHDGDEWVFRRDQRIRRPLGSIGWVTDDGLPVIAPEIALLFKAKHRRPKDEHDLQVALPLLDHAARSWLRSSLHLIAPDHPWLGHLTPDPPANER